MCATCRCCRCAHAGRIAADGARRAVIAMALSAELAASYTVRQADVLVEQALHSGAALLLFDGLDEVPQESARNRVWWESPSPLLLFAAIP